MSIETTANPNHFLIVIRHFSSRLSNVDRLNCMHLAGLDLLKSDACGNRFQFNGKISFIGNNMGETRS